MHKKNTHIIDKLTIDVSTSSVEKGYELKDNIRSFIDQHVLPAIEAYFASLSKQVTADQIIRFGQLSLTVNTKKSDWNSSELAAEIQQQFDQAIRLTEVEFATVTTSSTKKEKNDRFSFEQLSDERSNNSAVIQDVTVVPTSEHQVVTWIKFLETGTTSWLAAEFKNASIEQQEQQLLESILEVSETLLKKHKQLFEEVYKRLINQFSDDFIGSILGIVFKGVIQPSFSSTVLQTNVSIKKLISELSVGQNSTRKIVFWELIFRASQLITKGSDLSDNQFMQQLMALNFKLPSHLSIPNVALKKKTAEKKKKDLSEMTDSLELVSTKNQAVSENNKLEFDFQDDSVLAIILLEWAHTLRSTQQTFAYYVELQQSFLNTQNSASQLTNRIDLIDKPKAIASSSLETKKVPFENDSMNDLSHEIAPVSETNQSDQQSDQQQGEQEANDVVLRNKRTEEFNTTESNNEAELVNNKKAKNLPDKNGDLQTTNTSDKAELNDSPEVSGENANLVKDKNSPNSDANEHINSAETTKKQREEQLIQSTKIKSDSDLSEFIVENAGLVIIHPFLKHLLKRIGLLNEENQITDQPLAVHVLHYIATGRESDFEHSMLFEKFLIGMEFETSIPREIKLSAAIKQEIEELFHAVSENWAPMKSSSGQAIRETFVQRNGKLVIEEPNPRLVIERKTVDILLGQLSWSISIIRFPWLDEILYVEW